MFREFFSGIHYMHSQSIAHRDLKLENILITHKQIPKIADFSFAIVFDGRNLCTDYCGSLPYFAPELLMNHPYNPLVSDVWSLGVCLYIMTNDAFPFKFTDGEAMLAKQLTNGWKLKQRVEKGYSPSFKALLSRMLLVDTSARITAQEIATCEWLNKKPVTPVQ